MDTDDLEPPEKKAERLELETLSIEALGERIEELEAQIAHIREVIKAKEGARTTADSFFKS